MLEWAFCYRDFFFFLAPTSVCLVCLSICLCLSLSLSLCLSLCLSLTVCLCLSVSLSVSVSVCLSVCLSLFLSLSLQGRHDWREKLSIFVALKLSCVSSQSVNLTRMTADRIPKSILEKFWELGCLIPASFGFNLYSYAHVKIAVGGGRSGGTVRCATDVNYSRLISDCFQLRSECFCSRRLVLFTIC